MKAISIRQPWAGMIEAGTKTLEVRSWSTRHRGPLLVCASARPERGHGGPCGVALCTVDLLDVREGCAEDTADAGGVDPTGHLVWVLSTPRPVTRVAVKGRLGLFDVDIERLLDRLAGPLVLAAHIVRAASASISPTPPIHWKCATLRRSARRASIPVVPLPRSGRKSGRRVHLHSGEPA